MAIDGKNEDLMLQQVGEKLRRAELDIDANAALRLETARRQAVALTDTADTAPMWPWPVAFGSLTAVVLAAAIFLGQQSLDVLPNMSAPELAAAQEAELLEDLEFVAWMVAMEDADDLPKSG